MRASGRSVCVFVAPVVAGQAVSSRCDGYCCVVLIVMASAPKAECPDQLIKIACAMRQKYKQGCKVRLQPFLVGFHPKNRGGAKLSGLHVIALMRELLEKGFDKEEADCGGIVVESGGTSMVMDYNVEACAEDPLLIACVDGKRLEYGTLAHSHLNQVLKNLLGGCVLPEECKSDLKQLLGPSGSIDLSFLKEHDADFEHYVRVGLQFEVLSAQMEIEEPKAADIIQAAANHKNAIALIPHEMEAIKLMSKYCSTSARTGGQVCFESLKKQLAQSMPAVAYDPDFVYIFKMVIEASADDGPHINFLCDFFSQHIDPSKRRMRLSAFSVVTEVLPVSAPHMRIAAVVAAYCTPYTTNTYCKGPDKNLWANILKTRKDDFGTGQTLLFYFSETKKGILQELSPFKRVKFLGNLYNDLALVFCDKANKDRLQEEIKKVGMTYAKIFHKMTNHSCEDMPKELIVSAASAVADQTKQTGHEACPVILQFDESGQIVNDHLVQVLGAKKDDSICWKAWQDDKELLKCRTQDAVLSLVHHVCNDLWLRNSPSIELKFTKALSKDGKETNSWILAADTDIAASTLVLVPYVGGATSVTVKKSLAPDAVMVVVKQDGGTEVVWIQPSICYLTDGVLKLKERNLHTISRSPFWACRRHHDVDKYNCELHSLQHNIVNCAQWNGICDTTEPVASTSVVTVPVIINTKDIKKGSEIIVKCDPPPPPKAKAVPGPRTWQADVKKATAASAKKLKTK